MSLSRLRAFSLPLCASGNMATRAISEILVSRGLLRVPISSAALVHRKMCDTIFPSTIKDQRLRSGRGTDVGPSSDVRKLRVSCSAVDEDLKLMITYTVGDRATEQIFSWESDEKLCTHTGVFTATIDTRTLVHKSKPIPNCEHKFLKKPSLDRENNIVTIEKTPIPYADYFNN